MAKPKTHYSCQSCGTNTAKWLGRCPGCGEWNAMVEEREESDTPARAPAREQAREVALDRMGARGALEAGGKEWVPLDPEPGPESGGADATPQHLKRLSTGISELDRVLGGGLVPDSFVLLGGDPGIGKSTLLLQMAKGICDKNGETRILYVSGEESTDQIRGRAHRTGVQGKGQIFLSSETSLERVYASVKEVRPDILVMDSLQTFSSGALESAPGSVSQVREVAARLMALAKTAGICVWLVGHVTKDGNIAGPKAVEHMVDTVLYFEAESGQTYRLLRTVKNRFGSTRELGVFEMEGEGLREVPNPSSLFLSDRKEPVSGTAIAASLEGTRPILVELQALVAGSGLAVPRRTSVGMDGARVSLLAAILEKHMKLPLAEQDLFFNVAGGLKLSEPACDLAAAAAIWSSSQELALPSDHLFIGELGLTGEVRRVPQLDVRVEEGRKLGFKHIVVPKNTPRQVLDKFPSSSGVKFTLLARIDELPQMFR